MGKKEHIYEILSRELTAASFDNRDQIEELLHQGSRAAGAAPLRSRIIALGFLMKLSPEEVNRKLLENNCPGLYARSVREAGILYGLRKGIGYDRLLELQRKSEQLLAGAVEDGYFKESKLRYSELERYVTENSDGMDGALVTRRRTRCLQEALGQADTEAEFLRFLKDNLEAFSPLREKTRYYFCKHLYYYLQGLSEDYLEACKSGKPGRIDEALSALSPLKVVTKLRRNLTMPEQEKRELIRDSVISCGELFDCFNYFFFGYVSLDWARVLVEDMESPEALPPKLRRDLADFFRKEDKSLKKLDDIAVINARVRTMEEEQDAAFSAEGDRGYGRNRAGELTVYQYIRGTLDIDRTVLLCFLLFFASGRIPENQKLTEERLNEILLQCGYRTLDPEDDFDWFVAEYLESRHPGLLLDSLVTEYARKKENFFLYKIYAGAVSYGTELSDTL